MSAIPKPTWHGIPRENIGWHPIVVAERCVGCGVCVTSCSKSVYSFDYEANRPVVAAPQACMVGCTTCAAICIQDAIEFPSIGYVRQVIRKNRVLNQAKKMLKADPDRYDIKKRAAVVG